VSGFGAKKHDFGINEQDTSMNRILPFACGQPIKPIFNISANQGAAIEQADWP
jgi:hypothetical protein